MVPSTSISIKILAKNNDLKGKSFEKFMYLILDKLGYANFMLRVHSTGMEFDIEANHKQNNQSILCECKAHEKEMDTGELLRFYGKLCHERSKNKSLKGMFFSVSGFNGTALKNYSELNEEDKSIFQIYGNNEIVDLLKASGVFSPNEEIEKSIDSHAKGYALGDRYLVYHESSIYLVQLIIIAGTPRSYIMLTARGDIVERSVREQITALDPQLNSLEQLDLEVIDQVLLTLLDNKEKTVERVSKEIKMKYEDVKVAFEELKSEKIVNTINLGDGAALFKIVSDMDNLKRIMKKFEGDPEKKYKFMASIFVESLLDGGQFINFLTDRFYLSIDDRQRHNLLLLSRVFPSVLSMILFRYNDDFKNNYEQIEQSSLSQEEREEFRDRQAKVFMGEILSETYLDILNIPNKYLDSKGVRGFTIENGVKLATDNGLVIDLTDRQSFYLGKAAGVIKPGQLVVGGIDTIWKMAITLMDLREYNNAIEYFEKAISLSSDNDNYLVGAWNNKGVCYLRMTKYEEAIPCFNEVLSINSIHSEASNNRKFCLERLTDKSSELKSMHQRIEKILQNELGSN